MRLTATRALGALVGAAVFATGTGPLRDNSLFTHIATGRLIWDGTFPHSDPYTFTAAGEPWVVQSWLVSAVVGGLEELVGLGAVRLLFAGLGGVAMLLCWKLTAAARTPLLRLLVALPVVVIAADGWAQRPYLVAFVGLAAVLLVLDGRWRPELLVPVTWVWVNSHGSWPFAIAAVAAYWIGARLDGGGAAVEKAAAKWLAVGLVASVLNPYGPKIFTVPFAALGRSDLFSNIVEWQPPRYQTPHELAFLLVVAGAALVFARGTDWRSALPVVGFVLAGLYSVRNISPAAIVALPAVSAALAARTSWGSLRVPAAPVAALGVALAALGVLRVTSSDDVGDGGYPVDALAFMEEEGLDPTVATVVARDYVGNFFELVYGTDARVFVDDRFEVMPDQVAEDFVTLLEGGSGWDEALGRYEPDAVLWEADQPLSELLEISPDWEIAFDDDDFVVALPAG